MSSWGGGGIIIEKRKKCGAHQIIHVNLGYCLITLGEWGGGLGGSIQGGKKELFSKMKLHSNTIHLQKEIDLKYKKAPLSLSLVALAFECQAAVTKNKIILFVFRHYHEIAATIKKHTHTHTGGHTAVPEGKTTKRKLGR